MLRTTPTRHASMAPSLSSSITKSPQIHQHPLFSLRSQHILNNHSYKQHHFYCSTSSSSPSSATTETIDSSLPSSIPSSIVMVPPKPESRISSIKAVMKQFQVNNQRLIDRLSDDDLTEAIPKFSRIFYGPYLPQVLREQWSVMERPEENNTTAPQQQQHAASIGLKVARFFGRSTLIPKAAFSLFTRIQEHVEAEEVRNLLGVQPNDFAGEFFLWTIHLWTVFRRLQFEENHGKDLAKAVSEAFWKHSYHRMEALGVARGQLSRRSQELEEVFYGFMSALDQTLNVPGDWDGLMASVIWRNVFGEGRETDAALLSKWVRYTRVHLSMADLTTSLMLQNGAVRLVEPDHPLVTEEGGEVELVNVLDRIEEEEG
eukprot:gb/GECH01006106.1/.p1 GENE.gb/GECH01006106.1/~~gb/GECH01006106.1/.p1  ORF type:complete len:373 (+),score=72.50 gb/GECH01006106.1/:1-1119(+)